MAARAIGRALDRRVFAVDLSRVVSKYIGETEKNLDRAFFRRLRFVVEFPIPDAAAREKIWRQCLPSQAPLAADIDFRFLSRRVEITGGNIRQITLCAAFAAAAEGARISMRHILQATRAEVLKLGMPGLEREIAEQAA